MDYSLKSDKGIVRAANQDNCFVTKFDENSCFAVVCDGMGGPNAGDVASEIAVKNISERFIAGWRKGITVSSIKNLLMTAISAANVCIYDAAQSNSDYKGMGTTAVVAVVLKDDLIIANVGDSRAYLISDKIVRLTKDHSLVQQMIDKGELTVDSAQFFPYKNIITRALGIDENIEIDLFEYKIKERESIVLCSDGLTNFVDECTIQEIVLNTDILTAAEKLIETANNNGGGDNITAVIVTR